MPDSAHFARLLVMFGVILVALGLLVGVLGRFIRIGRLPGDISIRRDNFTFYFPLGTCILLSGILTLLSWLFRRR